MNEPETAETASQLAAKLDDEIAKENEAIRASKSAFVEATRRARRQSWTLLVLVVALAVLAGLLMMTMRGGGFSSRLEAPELRGRALERELQSTMSLIVLEIEDYIEEHGYAPIGLSELELDEEDWSYERIAGKDFWISVKEANVTVSYDSIRAKAPSEIPEQP